MSVDMDLSEDLENWMQNLPCKLKQMPLIQLAIPGSHDSCTSGITSESKIAPDAQPIFQHLKFMGPLLGFFMARWSKTQDWNVTQQTKSGIRYFDLRFSPKKNSDIFIVHGQYSCKVKSVLEDMQSFLKEHEKEVVIIDCQHFYNFDIQTHLNLISMFQNTFGNKLLPYESNMEHITLSYMNSSGYQVMVIYRHQIDSPQPFLWPSRNLPNPWPETDVIAVLMEKLNYGLQNRPKGVGFVSQCVLTPTQTFIFKNLFRSLKSTCVRPLNERKYQWLSQQAPGAGHLNIVISDFVNLEASKFSRSVISLNAKLLTHSFALSQFLTPVDSL